MSVAQPDPRAHPAHPAHPPQAVACEAVHKFAYVDALRGYAVLLVIASHVGNAFPQLPWPLRALTNFGFQGVELFFVVSCFTLMTSWQARLGRDAAPRRSFLVRRAFRILPMYLLAAALYGALQPAGDRFSWDVLLSTLTFTNGWHPRLLGTVDKGWTVVEGGWSITVEFTFYLLFPFLATRLLTLPRACAALVVALLLVAASERIALALYVQEYGAWATDQFIYRSLPAQLPVFAVGFIGWHLVARLGQAPRVVATLRRWQWLALALLVLGAVVLAFSAVPRTMRWPFLPRHLLASLLFLGLLCLLSTGAARPLVNRAVVWLGRVSFSAYLLHFAVFHALLSALPDLFLPQSTGVAAILRCLLLLAVTVPLTFAASLLTYRMVELPAIGWGGRVCRRIAANAAP